MCLWHKFPTVRSRGSWGKLPETKALPGRLDSAPNRELAMLAAVLVFIAITVICVTLVISGGHARYELLEYMLDSSGSGTRDSGSA